MSLFPHITADPKICGGEPCIQGTRIAVHVILDYMAGGDTIDDILKAFPQLNRELVQDAIRYASYRVQEELTPR